MTTTGYWRHRLISAAFLAATALAGLAAPASAQLYPGSDVSVNPSAAGGARVLRYPGGQYERVLPPLLEPGEPYPGTPEAPIRLHMPVHHAAVRKPPPVAESEPPQETADETSAPPPAAPPRKSRPAKREATAEPQPPPSSAAPIPFSFGGASGTAPQPPAKEPRQAERHPRTKAAPEKTASAGPAPGVSSTHGLAKQAAILFDQGSTELSGENGAQLKDLSSSLNAALASGANRVELVGYGGAPGDKSSDARRISLKRALAIRETLIADGLPASRIDVRALGGADDDGPANRVDIFVKG